MNLEELQATIQATLNKMNEPTIENVRMHLEKALDILCVIKYESRKNELAHAGLGYIIKMIDMLERLCN